MMIFFESSYQVKTGRRNAYYLMRSNDRFVFISFSLK